MASTGESVRLSREQLPAAGEVLGRAFLDDPWLAYVLPDPGHRAGALPALFSGAAAYGERFGAAWTTAEGVAGAAIWLPPGSGAVTPERPAQAGWAAAAARLGEEALGRFLASLAHLDALRRRDQPGPHWYLMVLGVDPPRQGRGIGGRLLQPALAHADAAGLPCYLETFKARNLPFYQRHGFAVVVDSALPGGGPRYWTMHRPPQP
jgi:GNAT superfamily N-acetyltransferase